MRRRWLRLRLAAAVLLVTVWGTLYVSLRRPPDLMSHARLVTPHSVPAGEMVFDHRWMPNGRLRVLVVPMSGFSRIEEVEPRTGKVVSSRTFNGVTNACWLSPDGKRLLNLEPGTPAGSLSLYRVFSVEDGRQLTCVKAAFPKPAPGTRGVAIHIQWKPNSREWMDMPTAGAGTVYRVDGGTTQPVTVPHLGHMVVLDSKDRLLIHNVQKPRVSLGYQEVNVSGPANIRDVPLQLPAGLEMCQAHLSPDERQIAWCLRFRESQPGWIQRLMALLGRRSGPAEKSEAVYICDRGGSHLRDLGRVLISGAEGHISALGWSRDGTALTFFQNNRLYAVAVAP